jgi:hypothetical protein
MHPKSQHTLFECVSLRKSLNAPLLPQDEKRKDQGDDNEGDKLGSQDFQDPKNVIKVIFGGDGGFPSKRAQKLTLCEILSIETAIQKPLRYNEVPISFSREDQWTSFSEPGKFLLILVSVVAGSQLIRVLTDSGSGLNLLFASTLKKMGLNISKMLTLVEPHSTASSRETWLHHLVQWSCQSPSERKTTTARSTSSLRWLTSSCHNMPSSADQLWKNSWPTPLRLLTTQEARQERHTHVLW